MPAQEGTNPGRTWVTLKSSLNSCTALPTSSADGRSCELPAPREKPPYLDVQESWVLPTLPWHCMATLPELPLHPPLRSPTSWF